jgi:hypothetical protein
MPPQQNTMSSLAKVRLSVAVMRTGSSGRISAQVSLQAARGEHLQHFREVLVDAPARQDFVANNDESDCHAYSSK